ncbi:caspase-3-like [Patiria miniata]|uniref:Uncharacterized protein n=1 Tax=Patiria miniata TaxID=46514 RepID=A0A913Z5A8_PATMI|nr:caspase-3-like [Patiria miniata]
MAFAGKPTAHTDLFLALSREMTSDNFQELKEVTKAKEFGNLKPGELEKIKNLAELFQRLEHKRIIEVGNYEKLKKILSKIDQDHLIEYIQKTESALREKGLSKKRDYEESAFTSAVAMETERPPPSKNNNNMRMTSQSSLDDAMPCGAPMDIVDVSRETDDRPRYPDGRGFVLFINNFVDTPRLRRIGCEKDSKNIEDLFDDELNYKFVKCEDLTKPKLAKVLEETKDKLRRGKFNKFILIICSHGEQIIVKKDNKKLTEERIMMVDDTSITEEDLTAPFMGDQLKEFEGKPKVFIIQACRSPRGDSSDDLTGDRQRRSYQDGEPGLPSLTRPVNADVLISYATTKGTKAWRNEEDGSWFIHQLCEISKQRYKEEHLMDLLVRVNNQVARMESTEDRSKQMPCQISTLTRHIWL